MKTIILGTAHLKSTPGKSSPDNSFHEYEFSREIIKDLYSIFKVAGYNVFIDIAEDDLPINQSQELKQRVDFVNKIHKKYPDAIYISIHVNAAGNGKQWMNASGWECYTSPGQTKADKLADYMYKSARRNLKGQKIREDWSDADVDKEAGFYVLKKTTCPAILTENFFMDSKKDLEYLKSDLGYHQILRTHYEGITDYLNNF